MLLNKLSKIPRQNTSDKIKTALMEYFRYKNGMELVCSEGINNADINALNNEVLIEVEIKISKEDFKKEFKSSSKIFFLGCKERKHKNYAEPEKCIRYIVPNKFYFCVPEELCDWAIEYLKDKNPKYGLMLYKSTSFIHKIVVKKSARKIHNKIPTNRIISLVAKRAASEIIILRRKIFI